MPFFNSSSFSNLCNTSHCLMQGQSCRVVIKDFQEKWLHLLNYSICCVVEHCHAKNKVMLDIIPCLLFWIAHLGFYNFVICISIYLISMIEKFNKQYPLIASKKISGHNFSDWTFLLNLFRLKPVFQLKY